MAFRAVRIAWLLSVLPVAGCGTAANLAMQRPGSGGVSPFGGVRHDVACIQKAANGELGFRGHPKSDSEQYPQRALMLFCAADLPLSFVGDLVTWPYTASYTYINQPPPVPPVLQATSTGQYLMIAPPGATPGSATPGLLPVPRRTSPPAGLGAAVGWPAEAFIPSAVPPDGVDRLQGNALPEAVPPTPGQAKDAP